MTTIRRSTRGAGGESTTILELEVDAGEPGRVADIELRRLAEAVDPAGVELGIEAGVLETALVHRAGGLGIAALGADRAADRTDEAGGRAECAVVRIHRIAREVTGRIGRPPHVVAEAAAQVQNNQKTENNSEI